MSGPSDCLTKLASQQAARHELLCLLKIAFHAVLSIRYVDEWLDMAAKTPTRACCLAARSSIRQLEKYWDISKVNLRMSPLMRPQRVPRNFSDIIRWFAPGISGLAKIHATYSRSSAATGSAG